MSVSRTTRAIPGTIHVLGRALVGAWTGLVLFVLTWEIFVHRSQVLNGENPDESDFAFRTLLGVVVFVLALLAAVFGKTEIKGRLGVAIKGVLTGYAAVLVAGAVFFSLTLGGKFGMLLVIFFGAPLGAIVGGLIGANYDAVKRYLADRSLEEKPPLRVASGIPDDDRK